ncbi:MAG: hypothetical protein KIT31_10630 [Deltaproteobacteria bacterium]|nr:hypothetical protein [Deltaproteobacteria bacterium]
MMRSIAVLLVAGACSGGGGAAGGGKSPAVAKPDPADLAKCAKDPADTVTGKFDDVDACRRYMTASFETGDMKQFLGDANNIADALCLNKDGLACRYRAIAWQTGIWNGRTDDLAQRLTGSSSYLEMGCEAGDQESCAILKTKVDAKKRTWQLAAPEAKTPED